MKKLTVISTAALLCITSLLSVASQDMVSAAAKKSPKKISITFSKSTDTMENGTKFSFKAKVKNAKASKVIWKSSNPKVISVNKKTGKASAKKAGKSTITARLGKQLVRLTVTVSPSAQDLTKANDTWNNLRNGVITSVCSTATSTAAGNDKNTIYQEYSGLDASKNITSCQTVEGSYFSYINHGIKHTLDYTDGNKVSSVEFSEQNEPNNNFIHYSNAELVNASINSDKTYTLIYMSDINTMTETEQASVGLDSGICVMTVIVEPKNLLVKSYQTTNYSSDGSSASTVNGTFVYNGENELTLPDEIKNRLDTASNDTAALS